MTVTSGTSTGSKRPVALFGTHASGAPVEMESAFGATVRAGGRDYLDFIMGLGAVSLGYAHPAVVAAAADAVSRGIAGPLPPADERLLADELATAMPQMQSVRFLKSGAEAMAAAVRIVRVATGRHTIIGCGYHGWLDWCSDADGVPGGTKALYHKIPFNDVDATVAAIRAAGTDLAAVAFEPVIDGEPATEWLQALREETIRAGALLICDEVKTCLRVAVGGSAERWNVPADLTVVGKALASGFPLAAVGGSAELMEAVNRTWISSTAATEYVALAAARAALRVTAEQDVPRHIAEIGDRLLQGLHRLARMHAGVRARGVAQMCYLSYDDDSRGAAVAAACARRGLLFKRNAYNFVSLAHDGAMIDRALDILDEALTEC